MTTDDTSPAPRPALSADALTAERLKARGLSPERGRRILDAATALFGEKGFVATTADEIAADAGFTKRTVYRYMSSKEYVLFAVHERMLDMTLASLEDEPADPSDSATVLLDRYVRAQLRVLAAHSAEATVFFEQMKYLSPDIREEVVARRDEYEARLREIIETGVRTGEFRPVDAGLMTRILMGMINDSYRWYRATGPLTPDEIATTAVRLFLHGLEGFVHADAGGRGPGPLAATTAPGRTPVVSPQDEPSAAPDAEPTTYDRILDEATRLFAQRGYQGTTSAELAAAAGLGKGALYYHIGSKARVLATIHAKVLAAGYETLRQAAAGGGAPQDLLRSVTVAQARHVARYQSAVRVLLEEIRYLEPEDELAVRPQRAAYDDELRLLFAGYVGPGTVPPEQLKVLVFLHMGALNFIARWYRPDGAYSIDAIGEQLADVILRGICAPPA